MFGDLQTLIVLAINVLTFLFALFAFIDIARRSAGAFAAAGRWSKTVWLAIMGAATAIGFLSLPPLSLGGIFSILGIATIAAVVFYFVDVRPKLPPTGSSGGSGRQSSRGGW